MFRLVCLLIGYAFGCIQTAYIVGKITAHIDIRQHGSGNAGTSNVIRVLGRATGVVVFTCDVLKTIAAYSVAAFLFGGSGTFFTGSAGFSGLSDFLGFSRLLDTAGFSDVVGFMGAISAARRVTVLPGLYAGVGAVLGHNFPFFMQFKGGKGIAATLGLLLAFDWRIGLIVYVAGCSTIAVTRFISLGSLIMTLLIPILFGAFGYGAEVISLGVLLAAMAWFLHRTNIARLRSGTERKFTFSKKEAQHG